MHAHAAETASDAHTQKTAESLPHQEALPGPEFENELLDAKDSPLDDKGVRLSIIGRPAVSLRVIETEGYPGR